ncbi:response regulator [Pedobacter aquatilis]|uniref:response regulator transcription factor n=1 Tax=Pedobacter aquatilis TaxID=351343 RepID=UPI0025B3E973|nr:response regulator [Pedobacter aquatilis]MDN3588957.1 response regulator [Pedobacter aquatilis]
MGKRICVLEDNEDIRDIIGYILSEGEYEVKYFANIADFKSGATEFNANLFLLDVMLPDGNGIDLCCELKADEKTQHMPIVMMSANFSSAEMKSKCKADDFIPKPFDIDDFVHRLDAQIH